GAWHLWCGIPMPAAGVVKASDICRSGSRVATLTLRDVRPVQALPSPQTRPQSATRAPWLTLAEIRLHASSAAPRQTSDFDPVLFENRQSPKIVTVGQIACYRPVGEGVGYAVASLGSDAVPRFLRALRGRYVASRRRR